MFSESKSVDRIVLLLLIAIEAFLFYNFYYREIANYPPQNYDQAVFLAEAYQLQDRIFSNGLAELWSALWAPGQPSGIALPIEGTLLSLIFGSGRLPLLLFNFAVFAVLQIFVFFTAQRVWHGRAFGYLAIGLILCQTTPWFWAGGMFDFRMDFVAYCLFGVWTCSVLRSNLFTDFWWAIACGAIGALLVLNRFLTLVYLLVISVGFALICVIIAWSRRGDIGLVSRMRRRLFHLACSLGVVVLVVTPMLIAQRIAIYNYYIVGHAIGQEKTIRAQEAGLTSLVDHLFYYPRSIVREHWGSAFLWAAFVAVAGALFARIVSRPAKANSAFPPEQSETFLLQIIFLAATILAPIIVLTSDIAKSPVVGGIVGIPSVLAMVALLAKISSLDRGKESPFAQRFFFATSLLILALSSFNQLSLANRHSMGETQRRDLERLTELDKWLVEYASQRGWSSPGLSVDVISGWFVANGISDTGFEQSHHFVAFRPLFGSGIAAVEQKEALSQLENSDFVILTTLPKAGIYPFYHQPRQYWNGLKEWVEAHMIPARSVQFSEFTAKIYTRPSAEISGLSSGWITSAGVTIEASRADLQRFPKIRLLGSANYAWLPKTPAVSATIENEGTFLPLPATFRRTGSSYEIEIDTAAIALPSTNPVSVRLNFDTFFVPKDKGVNADIRQLVIPAPNRVEIRSEL
jgi:hypothetical protein